MAHPTRQEDQFVYLFPKGKKREFKIQASREGKTMTGLLGELVLDYLEKKRVTQ